MFFAFGVFPIKDVPAEISTLANSSGLTWEQLESLLQSLRQQKPDLTVGAFQTFLHVARRVGSKEKPYIKGVAEELGMQYPTVARHCDVLSDGVGGAGGLGWIVKLDDKTSRAKFLTLSEAGAHILASALRAHGDTDTGRPSSSS